MTPLPADEKSVEVVIQHASAAVTEAQEDDGWVMIKAEMLSTLLDGIGHLKLARVQAQHERDCAVEDVARLKGALEFIRDELSDEETDWQDVHSYALAILAGGQPKHSTR